MQPQIQILKLDHNEFGSQGMIRLADGLAINPVIKILSVTYCGIDAEAAQAIFEILIFTKSVLEELAKIDALAAKLGEAWVRQQISKVQRNTPTKVR